MRKLIFPLNARTHAVLKFTSRHHNSEIGGNITYSEICAFIFILNYFRYFTNWAIVVIKYPLSTSPTKLVRMFKIIPNIKGIFNGLVNSFIFRPYLFFWLLGVSIFLVSLYIIVWIFINTYLQYPMTEGLAQGFVNRFGMAVAEVYKQRPYSFVVGGISLIISIQIMGMGFLSLQKKRYFDELFHLNSAILRKHQTDLKK